MVDLEFWRADGYAPRMVWALFSQSYWKIFRLGWLLYCNVVSVADCEYQESFCVCRNLLKWIFGISTRWVQTPGRILSRLHVHNNSISGQRSLKRQLLRKYKPFHGRSQINIFTSWVWNAVGDQHTRLLSELWTSASWDLRPVSHGAGFERPKQGPRLLYATILTLNLFSSSIKRQTTISMDCLLCIHSQPPLGRQPGDR